MLADHKEALAKLSRGGYVLGVYRWLIEVAFLFAAFTEFPNHKWSIGLGLLAFGGGVAGLGHALTASTAAANVIADEAERKTRQAIVLAAETSSKAARPLHQGDFWTTVNQRMAAEYEEANRYADKPTGTWLGFALATTSLITQLIGSVLGIGLVMALTSTGSGS